MDKLKEFASKLEALTKEYYEILEVISQKKCCGEDCEPEADGSRGVVNTAAE